MSHRRQLDEWASERARIHDKWKKFPEGNDQRITPYIKTGMWIAQASLEPSLLFNVRWIRHSSSLCSQLLRKAEGRKLRIGV
jgi:hypothetical protein